MTALMWTRASWGALLLLAPQTLAHTPAGPLDTLDRLVARALAGRQLAQATLTGSDPTPRRLVVGAWVDGLHATSMLTVAAIYPRHRPAAITDAMIAATFAAAGSVAAAHRSRRIGN